MKGEGPLSPPAGGRADERQAVKVSGERLTMNVNTQQ